MAAFCWTVSDGLLGEASKLNEAGVSQLLPSGDAVMCFLLYKLRAVC
jgi:hypothetical protein